MERDDFELFREDFRKYMLIVIDRRACRDVQDSLLRSGRKLGEQATESW